MDRVMASRSTGFFSSYDDVRPVAVPDRKEAVFCPKPRRLSQLIGVEPIRPLRRHLWQPSPDASCDSTAAGAELLEIILAKGTSSSTCSGSVEPFGGCWSQVPSSPPYFCGSPPSRAANPLVHDPRFLEEKPQQQHPQLSPLSASPIHYQQQQQQQQQSQPKSPTGASRKGGSCVRPATKFGPLPAAVRIEGFDCLDRDRRGCRISAVA